MHPQVATICLSPQPPSKNRRQRNFQQTKRDDWVCKPTSEQTPCAGIWVELPYRQVGSRRPLVTTSRLVFCGASVYLMSPTGRIQRSKKSSRQSNNKIGAVTSRGVVNGAKHWIFFASQAMQTTTTIASSLTIFTVVGAVDSFPDPDRSTSQHALRNGIYRSFRFLSFKRFLREITF